MWKPVVVGAIAALASASGSLAQDASGQSGSYRRIAVTSRDVAAERQALCDHATSVVARAGLSNAEGLSQAQLFSLFLVMSLNSKAAQQR